MESWLSVLAENTSEMLDIYYRKRRNGYVFLPNNLIYWHILRDEFGRWTIELAIF